MRIPPFYWWRTVFFLIPAIGVYTIVLGTLSLVSSIFDARGYFAHWCARTWARLILGTTGVSVRTEGLEHVEPNGSYVFVSNHQSHYDTAVLFATLPHQLRIIAKESLGNLPFVGWHLRRTGHILVDRRRPDRSAIFAWAERLLAQGLSLIVYPEGTRSPNGVVQRFKPGSFQIALQAGLPVVPISISGTRQVLRKGDLAARPGVVRLVLHPPIETRGLAEADPREFAERVRQIIAPALASNGAPSSAERGSLDDRRADVVSPPACPGTGDRGSGIGECGSGNRSSSVASLELTSPRGTTRALFLHKSGLVAGVAEDEMNQDELKGKVDQVKGKAKQALGDLTDDEQLHSEGKADELGGDVREGFGKARSRVGEAVKDLGNAIKR